MPPWAVALVLAWIAAPASALPPEKESWHRVVTESFVIYSNAGEKRATAVGRDLERFNEALDGLGGAKLRPSGHTLVLHLWGKAVLRPCLPRKDGAVQEVAGLFLGHPDGNVILLDAETTDGGPRTVQHELVHERLRLVLPGVPPWLDEGLAQFHETFTTTGEEVEFGHPIPHLVELLRSGPRLRLRELFATRSLLRDAWDQHPQFYATAWALTHYLRTRRPGGPAALATYASLVARGGDPVESAWTAFATNEAALTAELDGQLTATALPLVRVKLDGDLPGAHLSPATPAPRSEVLVALGELHLRNGGGERHAEAAEHFAAALVLDPSNATAASGLARCAEQRGSVGEARQFHEQAVALAPTDPRLLLAAARSRMAEEARSGVTPDAPPEVRERVLAARALLARCVLIDPRQAEAQALLGLTHYLSDSPVEAGIAALESAFDLLPSRSDIGSNLVGLLARGDRLDAARAALVRVQALGDRAWIARAQHHVLWGGMNRAFRHAAAGERLEALALADLVLADAVDHAELPQLAEQAGNIRTWAREAEASEALTAAGEHVRAGRHVEALAVLAAIDVAALGGSRVAEEVGRSIEELARFLASHQPTR